LQFVVPRFFQQHPLATAIRAPLCLHGATGEGHQALKSNAHVKRSCSHQPGVSTDIGVEAGEELLEIWIEGGGDQRECPRRRSLTRAASAHMT
jgi:transcriptional regulator of acetoin/glycerol metabolism